jgi:antitoxin component YwqK of YwqJK toxin-antitoxin module
MKTIILGTAHLKSTPGKCSPDGKFKEYIINDEIYIFEGEYLKGKKISGKLYNNEGKILLELKEGKGKEYYDNGNLQFEGEYINGKRWNGR